MAELVPYNQHFIHAAEVVGKPDEQVVFQYLWDMHCCKLRMGQPTVVKLSQREIASQRRMNFRTVKGALQHLEEIGLISIDHDLCIVNAKRYIALATAFYALKSKEDVEEFIKAVDEKDDLNLKSFGVDENIDEKEIILGMKGTSAKVLQNYNGCCKNATGVVEIQQRLQNYITDCKNATDDVELQQELQKYNDNLTEFLLGTIHILELQKYNRCCTFTTGVLQKCNQVLHFYNTENKENKAQENKVGEAALPYIGDDLLKGVDNIDEGENSQDQLQVELDHPAQVDMEQYHLYKERRRYPFFSADEISRIINDPEYCAQSPVYIFINILWETLGDLCSHDTQDEDGNIVIDGVKMDAESRLLPVKLVDHSIMDSYSDTLGIMERGWIEHRGVKIPVENKEFEPKSMDLIVDFEREAGDKEEFYRISSGRLHNIEAEMLPEEERILDRRKAVQADRERDYAYQSEIIRMGQNPATVDDLTPIEYTAYAFLSDNYELKDGEVGDPQEKFLRRSDLVLFYNSVQNEGVTEADFLGILFNNKPNSNDCLVLKTPRVFSSRAIEKWNAVHGAESKIKVMDEPERAR